MTTAEDDDSSTSTLRELSASAREREGAPVLLVGSYIPGGARVEANSGRETGKTVPGTRDCLDGKPDPASPVDPDLRIVYDETSQLRLLPREYLLVR